MTPKTIIHCTNFNIIKRSGCYMNIAPYKLSHGLIRNGHNVLDFSDRDIAKTFSVFGRLKQLGLKPFNRLFYDYCVDTRPDGIILGHADIITPKTLAQIRKVLPETKILQWNVDCINPQIVPENIKHIKSKIDLVDFTLITTADKSLLAQFEPRKHKVGFIPNPVDKSVEKGTAFQYKDPEWDLVFPSSPNSVREFAGRLMRTSDIVTRLAQNIDMRKVLFSRTMDDNLVGAEYQRVFANAAMGLCLNRSNHDYLYSSDRMAHLMGNGALAIIDVRSGFGDLFTKDEIAFYQDEDDMYRLIDFYRQNPEARMQTAQKGWQKYHELFNERLIAKYMAALMFDYPWPTLTD